MSKFVSGLLLCVLFAVSSFGQGFYLLPDKTGVPGAAYSVAVVDNQAMVVGYINSSAAVLAPNFNYLQSPGTFNAAKGISSDGSFAVGYFSTSYTEHHPMFWDIYGGYGVVLNDLSGGDEYSEAYAVSSTPSGINVVGIGTDSVAKRAVLWQPTYGNTFALPSGAYRSAAYNIDGDIIVGSIYNAPYNYPQACYWSSTTFDRSDLGYLAGGGQSVIYDTTTISGTRYFFGGSALNGSARTYPAYYSKDGWVCTYPYYTGYYTAVTRNGRVAVGNRTLDIGTRAFIDVDRTWYDLKAFATAHGVDVGNYALDTASDVEVIHMTNYDLVVIVGMCDRYLTYYPYELFIICY